MIPRGQIFGVAVTQQRAGNELSTRGSDGGLPLFAVGESGVELPPGVEGLAGPDPEAWRDAHDQCH